MINKTNIAASVLQQKKASSTLSFAESVIIVSSFLVLALPIPQLIIFSIGFALVNLTEIAYIVILLVSLFLLDFSRRSLFFMMTSIGLIVIILCKILIQTAFTSSINTTYVISDLRAFLPLIVSIALLSSNSSLPFNLLKNTIVLAALINSSLATYFFFSPPPLMTESLILRSIFGDSIERLLDANAFNVLFILFFIAVTIKQKNNNWMENVLLYLTLITSSISMFFTLNRTISFAFLFVFLLYLFTRTITISLKTIVGLIFSLALIVASITYFFSLNEQVYNLYLIRFNLDAGSSVYLAKGNTITNSWDDRIQLYQQYIEIIKSHPILGRDIGSPVIQSIDMNGRGVDVFSVDISLLSISFLFGLPGLILFCFYLRKVFMRTICNFSYSSDFPRFKVAYMILFLVIMLASLNDDILTRKSPILFLSLLAIAQPSDVKSNDE